ncbi:MAG: ankyrin repeat domain-containing protein [Aggregatilineales bacterium]
MTVHSLDFDRAVLAVIDGDSPMLQELLRANSALATVRSVKDHHATLLHYVAANGVENELQRVPRNAVEIATLLLNAGADPHALADIYGGGAGSTPFVGLISSSHIREAGLMKALIMCFYENGANLNGRNANGLPLATALAFRMEDAVTILQESGATLSNIILAAGCGDLARVMQMLNAENLAAYTSPFGEVVEDRPRLLAGALVAASTFNHRAVIEHLLAQGTNVNARGVTENSTALHEAVKMGYELLVRFLLDKGANIHLADSQGFMPLHYAAWSGNIPLIDFLLTMGANLEAKNNYGGTVLDTLVWRIFNDKSAPDNTIETASHLIESGANVEAVDYPSCDDMINRLLNRKDV